MPATKVTPLHGVAEWKTKQNPVDIRTPDSEELEYVDHIKELKVLEEDDTDPRSNSVASTISSVESGTNLFRDSRDEIYNRFTPRRKLLILSIICLTSFLSPISSTSILAAGPQVVDTFHTTPAIFDVSNGLYIGAMGLSPLFYGPLSQHYGRRPTLIASACLFTAFSLGTALAPTLGAYIAFRILTALNGTAFLIIGAAVVGDIHAPRERATAYAWFQSGTLLGPALGPLIGGLVDTYGHSWREIFALQTGLAGCAAICVFFFLPETAQKSHKNNPTPQEDGVTKEENDAKTGHAAEKTRVSRVERFGHHVRELATRLNPWSVLALFRYPNLAATAFATSALMWNMYALLTPIRYVLGPRFGLTTSLEAAYFYLAPGAGYLAGTLVGGRWADAVARRGMRARGRRVPEDRLRSCWTALGLVMPACMLVYGWTLERRVGGIPVPVIAMFVQGVAQTFCFASLNTYCVDVMPTRSAEVIAGNFVVRYGFAAAASAVCLPMIDRIGVGWTCTVSAAFLLVGAGGVWATTLWGSSWREGVDRKSGSLPL